MKGSNTFTSVQIQAIKNLIADKVKATPDKQKGIRAKIRNIGFHYSDFSSKKDGYTVADFEALIRTGQIKISDKKYTPTAVKLKKVISKPIAIEGNGPAIQIFSGLNSSFNIFKSNRFDPEKDSETIISNSPGNYILCLRIKSKLPNVQINPVFTKFEGLNVIYTGIAGGSLRTRDYRQHFKGNNAGRSTLRKSLGVLFGFKQIPRDSDPTTGKSKFGHQDELNLSKWMCDNLIMFFFPTLDFNRLEIELINQFNPPLNLKDNTNIINSEFRRLLSSFRTNKK